MVRAFGDLVQVFPLLQGQVNIALAGGAKECNLWKCSAAGDFTITWPDTTTSTITAALGDVYAVPSGCTVTAVGAAKFHFANV